MTRRQRENALKTAYGVYCVIVDRDGPECVRTRLKLAVSIMESLLYGDEYARRPLPRSEYTDRDFERLRKRIRNLADKVARADRTRADAMFLTALDSAWDCDWLAQNRQQ